MTQSHDENQKQKLDSLLAKVQKETAHDEFIYGVTNRTGRRVFDRINDFFVDRSSVPTKEKGYFYELLGTLLHAGIPLNAALKLLVTKTEHARLRRIIATVSYELEHGRPLSQALDRFPDAFDQSERGVIRSAEAVGNLGKILFKLADTVNRRSELILQLKNALIYPLAVLFSLTVGLMVMVVFVVPRIQEIFQESAIQLPIATRILLGTSVFLTKSWWFILIVAILGALAFHAYTTSPQGRFAWDFKKLRIPYLGGILRKIFVLRFVDTLGILTESGLPINKTLEFVADAVGNEVYRVKTFEALGTVQAGGRLSSALSTAPFLFPETVTNMIAVGEQSASLGEISQKVGVHFEREITYSLKNITALLGPALTLFVGAAVAFFALAVLSPIFSLTQAVQ